MKKNLRYILFIMSTMFFITKVGATECIVCGKDTIPIPAAIPSFVSKLILLVQILVPVILIVTGMIKYAKVVFSGEDKVAREVNQSFIRSIISAVVVFLVVAIVKFVFGVVDKANTDSNINSNSCIDCFINGNCGSPVGCPTRDESIEEWKQKGCNSYELKDCPSVAPNGTRCTKKGMGNNETTPSCKKACDYLGISACDNRKDCVWGTIDEDESQGCYEKK